MTNSGDLGQGPGNANRLFHNNGNGTFTDMAATEGVQLEDGVSLHKTAAWGDYNNDGFLDLVLKDGVGGEEDNGTGATEKHFLFKNKGNANHFIKVKLRGIQSNLLGLGARVTVTSTNGQASWQNFGGGGGNYTSQSSEPLHFGLGAATTASVMVQWPSGLTNLLPAVAGRHDRDHFRRLRTAAGKRAKPFHPDRCADRRQGWHRRFHRHRHGDS